MCLVAGREGFALRMKFNLQRRVCAACARCRVCSPQLFLHDWIEDWILADANFSWIRRIYLFRAEGANPRLPLPLRDYAAGSQEHRLPLPSCPCTQSTHL